MEIHNISKEIIKPSSSTPDHLRSFKLSAMDQFTLNSSFFSIVFFYSGACKNSDNLKKSLSETLTHYYPFAGRVKDGFSVDCDDYGATFVEASVAGDMSELIRQPKIELLEQLLPYIEEELLSAQVNMAVQVNYFGCSGVAICVSFRHVIADSCAAAHFVKNWSRVAFGGNGGINDVIFDCSSIFPSQDVSGMKKYEPLQDDENVTKWFVFENSKIAALQAKIGDRPTRFEALLALTWGSMIDAKEEADESNPKQFGALIPVNLRRKMDPPLPEKCIGNAITLGMTAWPSKETADYNKIVFKARELMRIIDEYVKKGFPNGWMNRIVDHASLDNIAMNIFTFSSSCRIPFYEIDFGWGKPVWFSAGQRANNNFALVDTSDGRGIEVIVSLPKEDMAKFEQDPAILAYASAKFKNIRP